MGVEVQRVGPGDGEEFVAAVAASRSLHEGWISPAATPAAFAAWLLHVGRDDQAAWVVRHSPCGGLVGYVSVANIVRRSFQSAAIGYGAFAGHEGRGLMRAGVAAVLDIVFAPEGLGLHRIEANIQPANARSKALAEGLGFELEGFSPRMLRVAGEWRDHERWALLSDRWRGREGPAPAPGG